MSWALRYVMKKKRLQFIYVCVSMVGLNERCVFLFLVTEPPKKEKLYYQVYGTTQRQTCKMIQVYWWRVSVLEIDCFIKLETFQFFCTQPLNTGIVPSHLRRGSQMPFDRCSHLNEKQKGPFCDQGVIKADNVHVSVTSKMVQTSQKQVGVIFDLPFTVHGLALLPPSLRCCTCQVLLRCGSLYKSTIIWSQLGYAIRPESLKQFLGFNSVVSNEGSLYPFFWLLR